MRYRHPVNQQLHDRRSKADERVDSFVEYFGSLKMIGWMTVFIIIWVALNLISFLHHWDPYPFILLNLCFSTQASYAAPLILMAQNRAAERDRLKAEHDYGVNQEALDHIRAMRAKLDPQ